MNDTTHTPTINESLRVIEAELDDVGESSLVDELLICETALRNIRQRLDNIRKRLDDPVHVVIDNYGGIVQDIDALETEKQAEDHFKASTGLNYEAVRKWEQSDRSYSIGLSDEFDTQIWEVKIRRDAK